MRTVAEFAPRSGTTSAELALHVLETKKNEIKCRFHIEKKKQKQAVQVDGFTSYKYIVVGVPYGKDVKTPEDGYMTCGCEKHTALWDFFWWKTWRLRSGNPKITEPESMKTDVLDTRHRGFFVQAYREGTQLELDDVYTGTEFAHGSREYSRRIAILQAQKLLRMANNLSVLGEEILYIRPWTEQDSLALLVDNGMDVGP